MPMTSGNFAKLLWPGANAIYGQAYKEHEKLYVKIYKTYPSKKAWEEDVGLSGFGLFAVKAEGAPIEYDTTQQTFVARYTHVVYAKGFIIPRELKDDNQYQLPMMSRAQFLAMSLHATRETIAANVLNRAFTNTHTGADGVELCATTHPNAKAGGTYANELENGADLSEAALEQACIDISKMQDDAGIKIQILPQILIVPPELNFESARILKSVLQNDSANNAINALKVTGAIPGGHTVNPYLTDSRAWFIKTNCPDGMKHFERDKDEFGIDNDWDTENAKFKARARFSFGWTDARGIFGSCGP